MIGKPILKLAAFAVLSASLLGCHVGDAPAGFSEQDAKDAISKMTPEQKIRAIASGPIPGPEKERLYKEIEAQSGVKASDVLKGGTAPGNVGQSGEGK